MTRLDIEGIDWPSLRQVRQLFLDGGAGEVEYWSSDEMLDQYDRTFGERIGWKWDHVLGQLDLLGWTAPAGPVLDWACGSGVAGRRFVDHHRRAPLIVSDRSARAERFALARASARGIQVAESGEPATLLVSHAVSELSSSALAELMAAVGRADCVVWVEPGDRPSSRALIEIRETFLPSMAVVAPCTHQASCPMTDPHNDRHWCHHFAQPPAEVFTDPGWGRFSSETGIDMRSVPVSYLVLDRRGAPAQREGAVRLIGRPRVHKPEAIVFGCAEDGLDMARISKRTHPDLYRSAKKDRLPSFAEWSVSDGAVTELKPNGSRPPTP